MPRDSYRPVIYELKALWAIFKDPNAFKLFGFVPVDPEGLTWRLLCTLRDRARAWRALLVKSRWLIAFFLLNGPCIAIMIGRNLQKLKLAGSAIPFIALGALPVIYGGVFLFMSFSASVSTREGRATPVVRHPELELLLLLLYGLDFLFLSMWAARHGYGDLKVVQALAGWSAWIGTAHTRLLGWLVPWRPPLLNFYVFFLIPFLVLVTLGNSPRAIGFRLPCAKRWALAAWGGVFTVAVLATLMRVHAQVIEASLTALFCAALPEEFLFRAALQTRIETLSGSPVKGIVYSALFFAGAHLGAGEQDFVWQFANAFGMKALLGFVFAHLYYRTRSLLPGTLLHGAFDVAFFAGSR